MSKSFHPATFFLFSKRQNLQHFYFSYITLFTKMCQFKKKSENITVANFILSKRKCQAFSFEIFFSYYILQF